MVQHYTEIENSYREKTLAIWLERYPELEVITYIIQEKIDGANVRLFFQPDKPMQVGSRGQMLGESGDGFYGFVNIMPIYAHVFDKLQKWVNVTGRAFTMFAEFFGKGIQKGINYNVKNEVGKALLFFDMWYDDQPAMETQEKFAGFMIGIGLEDYTIPVLGVVDGLKRALEFDQIFESKVSGLKDVFAEGIVIKPWARQYVNPIGDFFYLKKKNPKFAESRAPKEKKPRVDAPFDDRILDYITEQRVSSAESKYGPITEKAQISKYMKIVIDDAINDMVKDYPDADIAKIEAGRKHCNAPLVKIIMARIP